MQRKTVNVHRMLAIHNWYNLSKISNLIFGFILFQGPNGDPGVCQPSPVLY